MSRPKRSRLDVLAPYLITAATGLPFVVYYALTLRGDAIHFRYPSAFLLLASVPIGAWTAFHLERRRSGTLSFSRTADLLQTRQGLLGRLSVRA